MATRSTDAVGNETARTVQDWAEPALIKSALSERLVPVPGTGSKWRWFFSGIWLAYLIGPVADLFQHHHSAAWIAGGILITVAFCAIYLPTLMFCESRPRLALCGLGALVVLASVACLIYGKNWTPLWIYVSAAGGFVLTSAFGSRRATFGVFAITGCYLLFCRITHLDWGTTLAVLLPVLLIGLVVWLAIFVALATLAVRATAESV